MPDSLTPWSIRPRYLQRWFDQRCGKERVYFRKLGSPLVELKSAWGSQALADEVALLLVKLQKDAFLRRPIHATVAGAIDDYRNGADFLALAVSTRVEYERILDEMNKDLSCVLLGDVTSGYILDLRDAWAKRGYRAANIRLQIFKNVCRRPRIKGEIVGNPFELIEKVARPHELGEPNPYWEDVEVEVMVELALKRKQPGLARAIALGRWGGFRKQTICAVPLGARIKRVTETGQETRLKWVTEKKSVLCNRREDPRLTHLVETTPSRSITIAYNANGQRWKPRSLSQAIDRLVEDLAAQGKVRPDLTVHGLRHSRGVELARTGASDAEIMAQLDHATTRAAAIYRRQVERERLADASQDRVDAEIVRMDKKKNNVQASD